MTKRSFAFAALLSLIFVALSNPLTFAQNSVIKQVQDSQESFVEIFASIPDPKNPSDLTLARTKQGAGAIISPKGYIITNVHIIRDSKRILVQLHNGKRVPAQIKNLLPEYDLALIKITPTQSLKAIAFANSNNLKLKDEVINVGNSILLKDSLLGGQIIGIGSRDEDEDEIDLLKVNIHLYRGDSGGPLLNSQGELIGLMAAKHTKYMKTSLAIPSNKIKKLYSEYLN